MAAITGRSGPFAATRRVRRAPWSAFGYVFPFAFLALAMMTSAITDDGSGDRATLWIVTSIFAACGGFIYWSNRLELTGSSLRRVRPYWPGHITGIDVPEIEGVFLRRKPVPAIWGVLSIFTRWSPPAVGDIQFISVEGKDGQTIDLGSRNRDHISAWTQPALSLLIAELENRGVPVSADVWEFMNS